ncbi:plasmid replication initiator TrfA [Chitinibacter sp. FCG-7]|uniref:Plasmid replication initiator TrfA n=1 Tax=Chitinibacter mangrovi TaxID=3153927 RepID=A0AAU7F8H4_9NEIS
MNSSFNAIPELYVSLKPEGCGVSAKQELLGLVEDIRARQMLQLQKHIDQVPHEKLYLPLWAEIARAIPNVLLRSALFGIQYRRQPEYLERKLIFALSGTSVFYTGPSLDQFDLTVWESVLHATRARHLGDECSVTAYQLLKLIRLEDTGPNRKLLNRRLSRLNATALDIQNGALAYEGSLIDSVTRDHATRHYVIKLNPKLRYLFEKDQWTALDWELRQQLAGHPLALWLHGFYSTHAKPYAYSVDTLHSLCGSENRDPYGFKRDLRSAFALITTVAASHSQVFQATFEGNLVHVTRTPTPSQKKYLQRHKT